MPAITHPLDQIMDEKGVVDPHGISADVFAGRLRNMRQSTIGSFAICPTRVHYKQVFPDSYGGSDSTIIGTAYHAGMEHVLFAEMIGEDRPKQEDVYVIVADAVDDEVMKCGGIELVSWSKMKSVDQLKDMACRLYDFRMSHELIPAGYHIVGIETTFRMPWVLGWAATGTIDLLLWNERQGYRIVDHKSAGRAWDTSKHVKTPQPHWYAKWVRAALETIGHDSGPIPMDFEVMTYAGKYERRTITATEFTEDLWNDKALIAAQSMTNDGPWFQNIDNNLCSATYCDAWDWCPSGQAYRIATK